MKAEDLKPCAICGKGMMHAGTPLFYRVRIEAMGVDIRAVQQHAGMEMMMGGGVAGVKLARVLGPNPDIAKPIDPEPAKPVLVCQPCALEPRSLAFLAERA